MDDTRRVAASGTARGLRYAPRSAAGLAHAPLVRAAAATPQPIVEVSMDHRQSRCPPRLRDDGVGAPGGGTVRDRGEVLHGGAADRREPLR